MPVRFQRLYWPSPGFGNLIDFALPGHRPMPRSQWVGERADAPSGLIDTWREAEHEELEIEFRRIPAQDEGGATGLHGATGINAFLSYARDGGQFRLRLDRDDPGTEHTCQLVEDQLEREGEKSQRYRLLLRARDVNGTEFEV